jgi:hypothetical protein
MDFFNKKIIVNMNRGGRFEKNHIDLDPDLLADVCNRIDVRPKHRFKRNMGRGDSHT